ATAKSSPSTGGHRWSGLRAHDEGATIYGGNRTMKPNQSILAIALVFAVATASQARAQVAAPVAWSSVGSGCVLQSARESLASIDAAHGTVSFKPGTGGDIKLSCPVASLHQVAPNLVNDFHITFYMAHQPTHAAPIDTPLVGGVNKCFILA